MTYNTGLSLKKTLHMWLPHAKTMSYNLMACDSHEILKIGKKITELEIIKLELQKNLACFQT